MRIREQRVRAAADGGARLARCQFQSADLSERGKKYSVGIDRPEIRFADRFSQCRRVRTLICFVLSSGFKF